MAGDAASGGTCPINLPDKLSMRKLIHTLKTVAVVAALLVCASAVQAAGMPTEKTFENSLKMKFVRIEPGEFTMGNDQNLSAAVLDAKEFGSDRKIWLRERGDYDEAPVHKVRITKPFYMAAHEVTNEEFERFSRLHAHLRGKLGFSIDRDEAVVFVNWHEAKEFCDWLSQKEGLPYRLPTEVEWEYACRAGTTTAFSTGDNLPPEFIKNPDNSWYPSPYRGRGRAEVVPLHVQKTPPNPWGLFDLHGNVEEWCLDWYGAYDAGTQVDPVGRVDGDYKVSRGGSHGTFPFYMRSANRLGTLPESRSWYIGFRVVLGELPKTKPLPLVPTERYQQNVKQTSPRGVLKGPDPKKPYFVGPRPYVKISPNSEGPLYSSHNHDPDIAECPNGDLLVIWYTSVSERGRELAMAASRLRHGESEWEPASPFWDAPDRNDHAPALWYDGKKTLYHFNSLSAAATWGAPAIILRTSTDNGVSWTKARMINSEYQGRNQVVPSEFKTKEGYLVLPCDASPSSSGGSALHISKDNGLTWTDPGGTIAGIHTAVNQLKDGRLIAFGRGDNIDGQMPKSISADMGKTWTYSASAFPPVGGGQRPVMLRLKEGPLLLGSLANKPEGKEADVPVFVTDAAGVKRPIEGFFCAVSYDEGITWRHIRAITDDQPSHRVPTTDGWKEGRDFEMSPSAGEPKGYFAITQARNGVIHLISSWNHYAFNLKWLETSPPAVD